jgi:hypothetical protein
VTNGNASIGLRFLAHMLELVLCFLGALEAFRLALAFSLTLNASDFRRQRGRGLFSDTRRFDARRFEYSLCLAFSFFLLGQQPLLVLRYRR